MYSVNTSCLEMVKEASGNDNNRRKVADERLTIEINAKQSM
jgi:hypothetical protein